MLFDNLCYWSVYPAFNVYLHPIPKCFQVNSTFHSLMIPFAPPSKTEPAPPQSGGLSCHCSSRAANKGLASKTSFCKKRRILQMSRFPGSHLCQLPGIETRYRKARIGNSEWIQNKKVTFTIKGPTLKSQKKIHF